MRKGILIAALLVAATILPPVAQTSPAGTRQSLHTKKDYSSLNVVLYMTAW